MEDPSSLKPNLKAQCQEDNSQEDNSQGNLRANSKANLLEEPHNVAHGISSGSNFQSLGRKINKRAKSFFDSAKSFSQKISFDFHFNGFLNLSFKYWKSDLIAGITVAIVALPLALAFAIASGADPQAGIYTAIIAGILASLFGGSNFQITGPTGAMAVILIEIVNKYGIEKIWLAGFIAGLIQVILGLTKMGNLVRFIPYPVITGFTNGIAIIIFCGQLNNLLGLKVKGSSQIFAGLWTTFAHINKVNLMALGIGLLVIGIQLGWPKISKTIPGSLIALIVATGICHFFNLPIPMIGAIPQHLPVIQGIPNWHSFSLIRELMPAAFALAALGSIESLLSAMVADSLTVSEKHDSNQELIGQGIANMAVPLFGGIPSTGAIARTAVNIRSGGKTRLAGIIAGIFLALTLLIFAPITSKIPLAALAGILIVTSAHMLEWEEVKLLMKTTRSDSSVMFITWFVTIFFDLILAVEIGLIAAGILFIKRMSDLSLTKMPEEKFPISDKAIEFSKQIAVYRVDGPLFFWVAEKFVSILHEIPEVKILVLRMRYVSSIDSTGIIALEEIYNDLKSKKCKLILTGMRSSVKAIIKRSELLNTIGEENCFESTNEALEYVAKLLSISSPPSNKN
ncbi:MAG: SulP family inorganic anion transporter [Candidatus Melainabacteria bacterium]|jgi:SulP family sulfate permease